MSRTWEYCSLVSHGTETEDGNVGWICRVTYFTADGAKTRYLKQPLGEQPSDVFERAMAQLGAGGWELVSIQHQLVRDNLHVEREGVGADIPVGFSFSSFGVAYFKRRQKSGRPIDHPPVLVSVEE